MSLALVDCSLGLQEADLTVWEAMGAIMVGNHVQKTEVLSSLRCTSRIIFATLELQGFMWAGRKQLLQD